MARPLLTIPRLAIHLNRDVNESGEKLDRQTALTPLAALLAEAEGKDFFLRKLAREIGHPPEEILSYDLTVYAAESGCTMGFDSDLLSAPRLDNLAGVRACLDGLIDSASEKGIQLIALFEIYDVEDIIYVDIFVIYDKVCQIRSLLFAEKSPKLGCKFRRRKFYDLVFCDAVLEEWILRDDLIKLPAVFGVD